MLFTQRAILATGHISGGCKDTLVGSLTSAFGRKAERRQMGREQTDRF